MTHALATKTLKLIEAPRPVMAHEIYPALVQRFADDASLTIGECIAFALDFDPEVSTRRLPIAGREFLTLNFADGSTLRLEF